MRYAKAGLLILLLVVPAMLVMLPSAGLDGASPDPNPVYDHGTSKHIDAGQTVVFEIAVDNPNAEPIFVKVVGYTLTGVSKISAEGLPTASVRLDPLSLNIITVTVAAEKYAGTNVGTITFDLVVTGPLVTDSETVTVTFNVDVYSSLSAGSSYNCILGVWPSSFDPPVTALISFVLWIVIALSLSYVLLPFLLAALLREREKIKEVRKHTWRPFFFLIMLYGTALCARIYGIGEEPTAIIETFVNIAYIAVGALVVWRIYREVLMYLFARASAKTMNEIDSSLVALLELIGKIFIVIVAFACILASLGFNLMVIITGAGIVGLAISLGAQNTLSQFFSGISLLISKPFRAGDLITLDGGDVLMVKKIGLMTTEFDKWDTNSVFVLPNNKVAAAAITNITSKTDVFRTSVSVNIEYDSDIKLAKDLMLQAAAENTRVVKTRSPSARVNSFADSYIVMGLSISVDNFRDAGSIAGEVRESIVAKFRENGIRMAAPKMDVNVTDTTAE